MNVVVRVRNLGLEGATQKWCKVYLSYENKCCLSLFVNACLIYIHCASCNGIAGVCAGPGLY